MPLGSANVHLIDHSDVGGEDARGKQRIISRLRKGIATIRQEIISPSPQTLDIRGNESTCRSAGKFP
jgi:hypothetical protein